MLPIYETFYSWQGEGCHMGRAAFFIRTFGCPIQCPWCDSAVTWHPDHIPERIVRQNEEQLLQEVKKTQAQFVVVTGGEPAIHDLEPLTTLLRGAAYRTHLETSGAYPIRGRFDWLTVSPKWNKMPLPENLERASEIKLIVEDSDSIYKWWEILGRNVTTAYVWLHPEWSQRNNPTVLEAISNWVKTHTAPGPMFRVGYQLHKLYNVQ